jgi:hypothetical protein
MTILWESTNGSFVVLMNKMSPEATGFFSLYFDSEALSQKPLLICSHRDSLSSKRPSGAASRARLAGIRIKPHVAPQPGFGLPPL